MKYPHFSLSPSLPITRFFLSPAALVSSSTEDKRRGKLSSGAPSPSTLSFFLSLPSGRRQPWTGIIPGHEKAPQDGGAQISASSWTPLIVNRFGEGMSPIEEQIKSVSKVRSLHFYQCKQCRASSARTFETHLTSGSTFPGLAGSSAPSHQLTLPLKWNTFN